LEIMIRARLSQIECKENPDCSTAQPQRLLDEALDEMEIEE